MTEEFDDVAPDAIDGELAAAAGEQAVEGAEHFGHGLKAFVEQLSSRMDVLKIGARYPQGNEALEAAAKAFLASYGLPWPE